MTKVFVHGNPETAAIWGPLLSALADREITDTVAVSPPGFGAPLPEGWEPTPERYVGWLAAEVRAIVDSDGPVDIVGHDWGAGHVLGLAAEHPELIRSWAVDIIGLAHPEYVWHDVAQLWRTPEVGEQTIAAMMDTPMADRVAMYVDLGMTPAIAAEVAEAADETMGACILSLYRAADPEFLVDLGDRVAAGERRPSLALSAENDAYISADLAAPIARRFGSQLVSLQGQGHWWMIEDPVPAADALVAFWASLD